MKKMRIGVKEKRKKDLHQIGEDLNTGTISKTIDKLIEDYPQFQKRLNDQTKEIDELKTLDLLKSIGIYKNDK